ncbi:MAG TPA: MOSC domain-containing protein [Pirellulaceae bacterium]|jgi:hypothetical protein|nr:MOSC domain-containing protein [Pirellulaceae bacterium]
MVSDSTDVSLHLSPEALLAGLPEILRSPKDAGTVELIVRRPKVDAREILEQATLDPEWGVVGDDWRTLAYRRNETGHLPPDTQLTLMNSRAIDLLVGKTLPGFRERWALAGDQLYVDLDLSRENLPTGTRLTVGEATIEITATPHNGCKKFARRFGTEAVRFVNSPAGKANRLRGVYAKVVQAGTVRQGDSIAKPAS